MDIEESKLAEQILINTRELQKACHAFVEDIKNNRLPSASYQDATNMFLFQQIASIQLQMEAVSSMISDDPEKFVERFAKPDPIPVKSKWQQRLEQVQAAQKKAQELKNKE